MPQTDTASKEMPLNVSQLHYQCKTHRWHVETLWRSRCVLYLMRQPSLKPSVGERIEIARRGTEMYFNCHPLLILWQMHMVV